MKSDFAVQYHFFGASPGGFSKDGMAYIKRSLAEKYNKTDKTVQELVNSINAHGLPSGAVLKLLEDEEYEKLMVS